MPSEDDFADGHIESRRRSAESEFAPYYHDQWDVVHLANLQKGRDELSESADRTMPQLLDCADIDTIVDTGDKQIAIQEKVVVTDYESRLSIRAENNSDTFAAEADKLLASLRNPRVLTPGVIAVMSKDGDSVEWVRLIDAQRFTKAWDGGEVQPCKVWGTHDDSINNKLLFNLAHIDLAGATLAQWSDGL